MKIKSAQGSTNKNGDTVFCPTEIPFSVKRPMTPTSLLGYTLPKLYQEKRRKPGEKFFDNIGPDLQVGIYYFCKAVVRWNRPELSYCPGNNWRNERLGSLLLRKLMTSCERATFIIKQ